MFITVSAGIAGKSFATALAIALGARNRRR
jgi:hypothetical protein